MKRAYSLAFFIFLFASILNLNGQNKISDEVLSNRAICLKPNDEATLTGNLGERSTENSVIHWTASDPTVISLSEANNNSVKIKALTLGQSDVTLFVDRRPIQSCRCCC